MYTKKTTTRDSILASLKAIEAKQDEYPCLNVEEMLNKLGINDTANRLDILQGLVDKHQLLAFNFSQPSNPRFPLFQFNAHGQIHECVPTLLAYFEPLSDWATFNWFTSFNNDLDAAPADVLGSPEHRGSLMDVAGLYVNSNTFNSLKQ